MTDALLWSAHAGEYNDTAAHITSRVARAAFEAVKSDIPKQTSQIIDTCCGTGALTILAAEHFTADSGIQILATDYAEGMVAFTAGFAAAKAWTHVKTKVMDAGALSLPDSSCQAAFCIAGVICMEDGTKAVSEIKRVLSPGGLICFTTWKAVAAMPILMASFKALAFAPPRSEVSKLPWHEKSFLEKTMQDNGFTEVKIGEADAEFKVGEEDLIKFGESLSHNPVFMKLMQSMSEEQKKSWPSAIAEATRNLYGQKDSYDFVNVAYVVSGRKS